MFPVDIRNAGLVVLGINDRRVALDGGRSIALLVGNSDDLIDCLLRMM